MTNIKLVIEYMGARYHGWQSQPALPTIQGTLETCIKRISRQRTQLIGAGRTDAGVHALGQVANFKTSSRLNAESWKKALNALLPRDIVVLKAQEVSQDFHARRRARSKIYQYCILNRKVRSAILDSTTWHIPTRLRLGPMRSAARLLVGPHDFASFCDGAGETKNTRATIIRLAIQRKQDMILIRVEGTNFLHHMVRNIVGTLVQVGLGKFPASNVKDILRAKDRRQAGPTAPPQGLLLMRVKY